MATVVKKATAGIVLGIETSTSRGSVALCRKGQVLGELLLDNPRSHSERLLPAIETLLKAVALDSGNLEAVAVSAGPGSFTGLRIGVAAAKGLAFALAIPLYGIPSLEVLAANASPGAESVCAVIDARRGEFFTALFRATRDGPLKTEGEKIFRPAELAARLPSGTVVLGEIPDPLAALLKGREKDGIFLVPPPQNIPRAAVVALRGEVLLQARRSSEAESLVPFYLRPSDAERQRISGTAEGGRGGGKEKILLN